MWKNDNFIITLWKNTYKIGSVLHCLHLIFSINNYLSSHNFLHYLTLKIWMN